MSQGVPFEPQPQPRGCACSGCGCTAVVLVAILGVLFVLGSVRGCGQLDDLLRQIPLPHAAPAGIGKHLAQVDLLSLSGNGEVVVGNDLNGKVVLMTFWGTWCPPCRAEMPEIAALGQRFDNERDFRLLAVSCGQGVKENFAQLQTDTAAYLTETGLTLPCYTDPNNVTRMAVDEAIGFSGYPTTLLLDRKGAIQGVWTGYRPGAVADMERMIDRLLKEE